MSHRTTFTGNDEWRTPDEYIERARRLMGSIDLDPASSGAANESVRAAKFFTIEDDGLSAKWSGNVWLNPPYSRPVAGLFADKMVSEWDAGRVLRAVVLMNNCTDSAWFHKLAYSATALCFTRGRIRFISPKTGNQACSPPQGQVLFYFGGALGGFIKEFRRFGCIAGVLG